MRALVLLSLAGCGSFGLDPLGGDEGDAFVTIEPAGQIRFDRASPSGRSQSEEVTIVSSGGVPVYVADVWVESSTANVFYTGNELPFPKTMDPGEELPVVIRFAPVAAGTFHGTLVVEAGTEGAVLERQLVGEGCADTDRDGEC
jgi:hypothetical protein